MRLRVTKPGILSTIQDLGRTDFLADAVPVSGAMDTISCRLANIVLGNPENAAVVEFTYHGAELYAETELLVAFSGEGATLQAGGESLPSDRPLYVPAGTYLSLKPGRGCRSYLAVSGGWNVPQVLGSRSTFLTAGFGGLDGRQLQENDELISIAHPARLSTAIFTRLKGGSINYSDWGAWKNSFLPKWGGFVRAIPGREFTLFSAESLLAFLSEPFKVGLRGNRMAYQLEGPPIVKNKQGELISSAVCPGTIQVTGDGNLMLLMADAQTTGGYPRIAQVAAADLPVCAQLKPGDLVYFEEISRKDAEKLLLEQEQKFRELKATMQLRFGK